MDYKQIIAIGTIWINDLKLKSVSKIIVMSLKLKKHLHGWHLLVEIVLNVRISKEYGKYENGLILKCLTKITIEQ